MGMLKERDIDRDGLLLCDIQARAFENSVDSVDTSSEIFIRRFMFSDIVRLLDNGGILETTIQPADIIEYINEQYGESDYGSVKYTKNEMHWIGYLYRYYCYTYELTSRQVYRIIKPKELRGLYQAYHTLDPAQAIERIREAKGLPMNEQEELERQYAIFRKVRFGL